jgi:molecular chaperone DnaK
MTADLLGRTKEITRHVLQIADVDPSQLDEVVLSGAACRMPAVVEMLEEVCGRELPRNPIPPEAVAVGAAIYSKILEAN